MIVYFICTLEAMITVFEQDGKKLITSIELYKKAGYSPSHYSRFLNIQLYNNAEKGIDYFDMTAENSLLITANLRIPKSSIKYPKIYMITFDMAITICLIAKTDSAKKLKFWLQKNK